MRTVLSDDLAGKSGAVFSSCMAYRYRLWREWNSTLPTLAFCMLNPSTADEVVNDPTIERCQRRAINWGFGRLEIINIFALRSTDPAALYDDEIDPVGDENDRSILECFRRSDRIICGWGRHGALLERGDTVLRMLLDSGPDRVYVLEKNDDGSPRHPLYVPYSALPKKWSAVTRGVRRST